MSNKKPKNFYRSKWYLDKGKSSKVYNDKDVQGDKKVCQSLDPLETHTLLNTYNTYVNFNIPYYGWKLFFYNEDYKNGSDTVKKVETVESFIRRHQRLFVLLSLENLENGLVFPIDMREVCSDKLFLNEWSEFERNLYENPLHTLNCFKLAIHQQILSTVSKENLSSINIINTLSTVRLKILNYEPIISLQDLKASSHGRLVSIRGCVIRVGCVKHLAQWIVFICRKCNLQKVMRQPLGVYTIPKTCDICGISKFRVMLDSALVKSITFQVIKIQEVSNNDQNSKGSMPRMVDIELMDDLVNTCMIGDDITLTGIIKGANSTKARNKISFSLYMEAITIMNNKQRLQNKDIMNNEMSIKDYLAIKEVYNTPNIFPLLVHSLCPSIYGHDIVKAGLVLSLFGGNAEHLEFRENIHTLIVGDPGLGKSQMLQASARIAPKGVYVCGNSSTSSGLTITLAKENKSNKFTLEPGALVLTDKGCCCIDEFDKMYKHHTVLLEAMEQQSVSVAKSGVICSLPTRTSILAAANPISGRFNRNKTVMQNLKMSAPLISRFDLIFLLLDEPNKHVDDLLCKHVMSVDAELSRVSNVQSSIYERRSMSNMKKLSLRDKLECSVLGHANVIPQSILRKYIAYARQYVKPKLTKEAAAILQNYYLELRKEDNKCSNLSVCNRQLEAMIRLTEARAKLELRAEAIETDALDVIDILQYTFDKLKMTSYQSLSTKSITNEKVKEYIMLLRREAISTNSKVFSMKKLRDITFEKEILRDNFPELIAKLNESGVLLKMGHNTYKFISY